MHSKKTFYFNPNKCILCRQENSYNAIGSLTCRDAVTNRFDLGENAEDTHRKFQLDVEQCQTEGCRTRRFLPIRSFEHDQYKAFDNFCRACGEAGTYREYRVGKSPYLPSPGEESQCWFYGLGLYDVYACNSCGHVFSYYNGDVEDYHRKKYRKDFGLFNKEERLQLLRNSLAAVKDFIDPDNTILEVGSGDGMLSSTLRENLGVKNINCCELDPDLVKKCEDLGFKTFNQSILDIKNHTFDIVIAMDVLEHIVDLQQFRDKMEELVNKYLILQVPTKRTGDDPNFNFDGHSHYFNPYSMSRLFEKSFDIVHFQVGEENEFARGKELLFVLQKKEN